MTEGVVTAAEISAGMGQIITFWKLLPEEWKQKARLLFKDLWEKGKVVISDERTMVEETYEVEFEDERLKELVSLVNSYDRACLIAGKQALNAWERGLTDKSTQIRDSIGNMYGTEGLKIVNMITTEDIEYILDDLEGLGSEEKNSRFSEWKEKYNQFSKRVKVSKLHEDPEAVKEEIKELASNAPKEFIILHIAGGSEDIIELRSLLDQMKNDEELSYDSIKVDTFERGFKDVGQIEIHFNT